MILRLFEDKASVGEAAASQAAAAIRHALTGQGKARIVAATGASQFEFLSLLATASEIDWRKVELFHLDEYVGLPVTHPASFGKYLLDRLIRKTAIEAYYLLDGEGDPSETIATVGAALAAAPVDVAFVGIGENGHLAFNDPPADFENEAPYMVVDLDEASRRQQVGEGWFSDISEVPQKAITMTIRQIMKSKEIICIAPEARKARAVKACFEGEVSPLAPASVLRNHSHATVYLDRESAHLLSRETILSLSH